MIPLVVYIIEICVWCLQLLNRVRGNQKTGLNVVCLISDLEIQGQTWARSTKREYTLKGPTLLMAYFPSNSMHPTEPHPSGQKRSHGCSLTVMPGTQLMSLKSYPSPKTIQVLNPCKIEIIYAAHWRYAIWYWDFCCTNLEAATID